MSHFLPVEMNRMISGPFRGVPIQSELLWLTCVFSSDLSWQPFGPDLVLMLYPESLVQKANVSFFLSIKSFCPLTSVWKWHLLWVPKLLFKKSNASYVLTCSIRLMWVHLACPDMFPSFVPYVWFKSTSYFHSTNAEINQHQQFRTVHSK